MKLPLYEKLETLLKIYIKLILWSDLFFFFLQSYFEMRGLKSLINYSYWAK